MWATLRCAALRIPFQVDVMGARMKDEIQDGRTTHEGCLDPIWTLDIGPISVQK